MSTIHNLHFWKKTELDAISPSFCAAKWKQVTIHLQNGHTHSCHHPRTHKIPLEELDLNPSALHNTNYKKEQRKKMLEGIRPEECGYCWKIEDESNGSLSDRVFKSSDTWSAPYIPEIVSKPWDDDVVPSYIEVSFSHVCNFKCSYCAPNVSSQWMEEIEKFGPYPTSDYFNNLDWVKKQDMIPILHRENNPYVEAFWKWWPNISNKVEHFRITGGEPLLSKDTFKFLDYLIENPQPNLNVSVNSNMCPPSDLLNKFIEKVSIIIKEKKVKSFKLFTSAEAHGKQAEYIRFGMNYETWFNNVDRVLKEIPDLSIVVMSTYNALSVPSYIRFLEDIVYFKKKFRRKGGQVSPIYLDIPYLRFPTHQTVFILTEEFEKLVYDQVTFMYQHLENKNWEGSALMGFHEHEAERMKRIYEMVKNHPKSLNEAYNDHNRKNFKIFVDEHDRRRGTNFLEVFPEMENFYKHCGSI
jgi:organic radical activating enzyme